MNFQYIYSVPMQIVISLDYVLLAHIFAASYVLVGSTCETERMGRLCVCEVHACETERMGRLCVCEVHACETERSVLVWYLRVKQNVGADCVSVKCMRVKQNAVY
jgi:hypothetical protein